MTERRPPFYEFGEYRIDVRRRLLLRGGEPVSVTPKVFALLLVLVENAGRALSKERLIAEVWSEGGATPANLSVNVASLRKALGEGPRDNRFVATIPVEGYQFVGAVTALGPTGEPVARHGATLRTIVVLPFRAGDDGTSESVGNEFAEGLIARLSQERDVVIPGAVLVERFAGKPLRPLAVARELGAEGVLTGTVRRNGKGMEVTAALIRVADGTVVCGDTCRDVHGSTPAIRERIVQSVLQAIGLQGTALGSLPAHSSEAATEVDHLYMKGRVYRHRLDPGSLRAALGCFEEVVARRPDFAEAQASLAEVYFLLWRFMAVPAESGATRARTACRTALELNPGLVPARLTWANLTLFQDWDWRGAEAQYEDAIRLDPNFAPAYQNYTYLLLTTKRPDEALDSVRWAQRLDPTDLFNNSRIGLVHYIARRYDRAMERFHLSLEMDPGQLAAIVYTVLTRIHLGELSAALELLDRASGIHGTVPLLIGLRILVRGRLGRAEAAREELEALHRLGDTCFVHPVSLAFAYLGLKDLDGVFTWLERAYEDRDGLMAYLGIEPLWDEIRGDPRFRCLCEKVGFP